MDNLFLGFPPKSLDREACIGAIQTHFELNDLGPVSYTLGTQVEQNLTLKYVTLS